MMVEGSFMKRLSSKSGWSMIEVVLVIAILGTLAMAAFSKFYNVADQAESNRESYIIGSVQEGIDLNHAVDVAGH